MFFFLFFSVFAQKFLISFQSFAFSCFIYFFLLIIKYIVLKANCGFSCFYFLTFIFILLLLFYFSLLLFFSVIRRKFQLFRMLSVSSEFAVCVAQFGDGTKCVASWSCHNFFHIFEFNKMYHRLHYWNVLFRPFSSPKWLQRKEVYSKFKGDGFDGNLSKWLNTN